MATRDSADRLKILEGLNTEYQRQIDNLKGVTNQQERSRVASEQIANYQKMITELMKEQVEHGRDNTTQIDELRKKQKSVIDNEKQVNTQLKKGVNYRQKSVDLATSLSTQMKGVWKFLQEGDKSIRSTNLQLGLSGMKAEAMRSSFKESVGLVTKLGGTFEDIGTIMQGFAEETGRARALTGSMVDDITLIGRGTGLGIEQATKLGAQFELMGLDTRATMEFVQGTVDTTERMGVNTTKVLKNISDNFKKLNTYTFQQGVRGFAEMASYAEKFKIDIGDALNAADVAKSLEGAIDLTARLQVMGGEFARTDPFEMLFLARNDPAKFTEKIADMTKGVVSFRKVTDIAGKTVFEKFISPADRDRLAAVAKSLGMEASALTEIAQRQAEIQKMRQQMQGMGLSEEQKELIEGAAMFDSKSGNFQVKVAGTLRDISDLTQTQAKAFEIESIALRERAEEALTFDETFKATITILKATLLPLIEQFNDVFLPKLQKISDRFVKWSNQSGGWIKAGGTLLAAAIAMKAAGIAMNHGISRWINAGGGRAGTGVSNMLPAKGVGSSGLALQRAGIGKGAAARGAGMKSLGAGAGIGAAAVGMGAGVGLAAAGISKLADAMSKLSPEQAKSLERIAITLAVTFPLAAIGIGIVAAVAAPAAVPLLALGAALLMVGGAVGVAAAGIGFMAKGFGDMFEASKGAGDDMIKIGAGIGIMASSLGLAAITLPTAIGLSMVLNRMGKSAPALATIGGSLQKIKTGLTGSRDDYEAIAEAIKTISGLKLRKNNAIAQMAELMSKPLKVEFDKGKVNLINDITLNLDGEKFMRKSYRTEIAVQKHESKRNNKGD